MQHRYASGNLSGSRTAAPSVYHPSLLLLMLLAAACVIGQPLNATAQEVAEEESTKKESLEKINISIHRGKYQVTLDMRGSPDLQVWAKEKLSPVISEWYPKIVHMLPSKDFEAPRRFKVTIGDNIQGVAYTSGTQIYCNGIWFKQNLEREALGAVVHEMVHVVQQYRRGRRVDGQRRTRPPGWLVEGVPDYIRWFLYEPESRGARISPRRAANARHDASYRTSANFLDWVTRNYGIGLIAKVNAILRAGEYHEDFWSQQTGKSVDELAAMWKESLANPQAAEKSSQEENQLTAEEKEQGWKLLFDGESTDGWHSFRRDEVLSGWKVKDGVLVCQDPSKAGDLCTDDMFEWFELQLEYNISPGGNSGIMYHVTNEGGAAWATGPEFQLEDNQQAHDSVRCGWLYALYQPPADPDTGAPIDATKPAGQWNKVRLLVSPDECSHEINGVKYFSYKLGSEDFLKRVKASKFSRMPLFAKPSKGMVALQGDHGVVSFRNVKLRPISAEAE